MIIAILKAIRVLKNISCEAMTRQVISSVFNRRLEKTKEYKEGVTNEVK